MIIILRFVNCNKNNEKTNTYHPTEKRINNEKGHEK